MRAFNLNYILIVGDNSFIHSSPYSSLSIHLLTDYTMVLVLNGVLQDECPLDTASLFLQHPVYRDHANQLLSIPIRTVSAKFFLFYLFTSLLIPVVFLIVRTGGSGGSLIRGPARNGSRSAAR